MTRRFTSPCSTTPHVVATVVLSICVVALVLPVTADDVAGQNVDGGTTRQHHHHHHGDSAGAGDSRRLPWVPPVGVGGDGTVTMFGSRSAAAVCDGVTNSTECSGCDIKTCVAGSTTPRYQACLGSGPQSSLFMACNTHSSGRVSCSSSSICTAVYIVSPLPNTTWVKGRDHLIKWAFDTRTVDISGDGDGDGDGDGQQPQRAPIEPFVLYLDDPYDESKGQISLTPQPPPLAVDSTFIGHIPRDAASGLYRLNLIGWNHPDIYGALYPVVLTDGDAAEPEEPTDQTSGVLMFTVGGVLLVMVMMVPAVVAYRGRKRKDRAVNLNASLARHHLSPEQRERLEQRKEAASARGGGGGYVPPGDYHGADGALENGGGGSGSRHGSRRGSLERHDYGHDSRRYYQNHDRSGGLSVNDASPSAPVTDRRYEDLRGRYQRLDDDHHTLPKRKKFHHERVASASDYGSMLSRDRSHSEERMRLLESRAHAKAHDMENGGDFYDHRREREGAKVVHDHDQRSPHINFAHHDDSSYRADFSPRNQIDRASSSMANMSLDIDIDMPMPPHNHGSINGSGGGGSGMSSSTQKQLLEAANTLRRHKDASSFSTNKQQQQPPFERTVRAPTPVVRLSPPPSTSVKRQRTEATPPAGRSTSPQGSDDSNQSNGSHNSNVSYAEKLLQFPSTADLGTLGGLAGVAAAAAVSAKTGGGTTGAGSGGNGVVTSGREASASLVIGGRQAVAVPMPDGSHSLVPITVRSDDTTHPYECPLCFKRFTQKGNLTVHLKNHSGIKRFQCPTCHKRFAKKQNLQTHIRTHSAARPFVCSRCDRAFNRKGNLTRHMRTHLGIRPYPCPYCTKRFADTSNFHKHVRRHHPDKPAVRPIEQISEAESAATEAAMSASMMNLKLPVDDPAFGHSHSALDDSPVVGGGTNGGALMGSAAAAGMSGSDNSHVTNGTVVYDDSVDYESERSITPAAHAQHGGGSGSGTGGHVPNSPRHPHNHLPGYSPPSQMSDDLHHQYSRHARELDRSGTGSGRSSPHEHSSAASSRSVTPSPVLGGVSHHGGAAASSPASPHAAAVPSSAASYEQRLRWEKQQRSAAAHGRGQGLAPIDERHSTASAHLAAHLKREQQHQHHHRSASGSFSHASSASSTSSSRERSVFPQPPPGAAFSSSAQQQHRRAATGGHYDTSSASSDSSGRSSISSDRGGRSMAHRRPSHPHGDRHGSFKDPRQSHTYRQLEREYHESQSRSPYVVDGAENAAAAGSRGRGGDRGSQDMRGGSGSGSGRHMRNGSGSGSGGRGHVSVSPHHFDGSRTPELPSAMKLEMDDRYRRSISRLAEHMRTQRDDMPLVDRHPAERRHPADRRYYDHHRDRSSRDVRHHHHRGARGHDERGVGGGYHSGGGGGGGGSGSYNAHSRRDHDADYRRLSRGSYEHPPTPRQAARSTVSDGSLSSSLDHADSKTLSQRMLDAVEERGGRYHRSRGDSPPFGDAGSSASRDYHRDGGSRGTVADGGPRQGREQSRSHMYDIDDAMNLRSGPQLSYDDSRSRFSDAELKVKSEASSSSARHHNGSGYGSYHSRGDAHRGRHSPPPPSSRTSHAPQVSNEAAQHLLDLGSFKSSSLARAYSEAHHEDATRRISDDDCHDQIPRARIVGGPDHRGTSSGASDVNSENAPRSVQSLRDRNSSNVSNLSGESFVDATMTVGQIQSLSSGLAPMVPDFPPNVFSGAGDLHASVTAPSQTSGVAGSSSTLSSGDMRRSGATIITPPSSLSPSSRNGEDHDRSCGDTAIPATSESLSITLTLDHSRSSDDVLTATGGASSYMAMGSHEGGGGSGSTADALMSDSSSSMFTGHSSSTSLTTAAGIEPPQQPLPSSSALRRQLAESSMALAAPPSVGESPPAWFSKGTIPISEDATHPLLGDAISPPASSTLAATMLASSPPAGVGHLTSSGMTGTSVGATTASMIDDANTLSHSIEPRDMSGGSLLGDTSAILSRGL